jgi:hypothetical protein
MLPFSVLKDNQLHLQISYFKTSQNHKICIRKTLHIFLFFYPWDNTHIGEPVPTTQQPSGMHIQDDPAKCPVSAVEKTDNVSVLHAGYSVQMSRTSL